MVGGKYQPQVQPEGFMLFFALICKAGLLFLSLNLLKTFLFLLFGACILPFSEATTHADTGHARLKEK
jgi:hypothetical protein